MNTPAISNLINPVSGPTPAAKPSGASSSSDTQFNKMLSREVADRRNINKPSEPSKPIAKESRPADQASQTAPSTNSNKADSSEDGKTSTDEEGTTTSVAESAPASVEHSKARADAEPADEEASFAATCNELLALVANLSQASTVPAQLPAAPADNNAQNIDASLTGTPQAGDIAATTAIANTIGANRVEPASAGAAPLIASAGKDHITAQPETTKLLNRPASDAPTRAMPGETNDFDATLAQAKETKAMQDAGTAPAQSTPDEFADRMQTGSDVRASKPAHDTQSVTAQITPLHTAAPLPAPLQQVQAAASAAADKLAPRVGNSGWDQALGQKIVWMASAEQQGATLTLNPPDLGPLQVVLNVSNSQATVDFTAAQPEVRQALQDAMPKLREMLGDAGIQLGQANVSAGTPNNQQGGSGERQQGSRGDARIAEGGDTPVRVERGHVISGGQGLVDTFA